MVSNANDMLIMIGESLSGVLEYYPLKGATVTSFSVQQNTPQKNTVQSSAWNDLPNEAGQKRLQVRAQGVIHEGYADVLLHQHAMSGKHCHLRLMHASTSYIEAVMSINNYTVSYEQDNLATYALTFVNAGNITYPQSA